MFLNPDLLPESVDPQYCTRHDCVIIHEQICGTENIKYYDDIDNNGRFIIEDCSPYYEGYEVHIFEGIVLRENNDYS